MSAAEVHVLFFGDSRTVGVGDPSGLGWIGRVAAASHAAGIGLVPYNLGVRGEMSKDVLRRWQTEARTRSSELETKVVFAVGANDTTEEDGAVRCEVAESVETLAALLRQSEYAGMSAMVVGPAPVGDERQMERIAQLSHRYAELCKQNSVPFVNVEAALRRSETWRKEIASDEAHPAAVGYEELAGIVLDSGWLSWVRVAARPL